MFFKQRINDGASIAYFFGYGGLGKAVAVDVVAGDEAWFAAEAQRAGVLISHVIDTHIHADHYSGGWALHAKVLPQPAIEVFPGHQAGSLCGAGLSGKPSSTLAFEKRWNPVLSLDRAGFIDHVTSAIPPRLPGMDEIVRANVGLAE
ncbi:hypothetical protein H3H36_02755 [Duganella sp. FT3S]|uniref:MBL fold metallo-hydrolase n=1 Tax=Rugamonas fusca TaxID=2758568 RepID=A0A7W2I5H3_9BURK|nr:hypothetical protein [Rugamonas fusca]MBA5604280.1 hypothetical protein [Rugamonas fusca]